MKERQDLFNLKEVLNTAKAKKVREIDDKMIYEMVLSLSILYEIDASLFNILGFTEEQLNKCMRKMFFEELYGEIKMALSVAKADILENPSKENIKIVFEKLRKETVLEIWNPGKPDLLYYRDSDSDSDSC